MKTDYIRIAGIVCLSILSLASCKKTYIPPLSDSPFDIEIKNIQAEIAWIDIVPENNDFHYNMDFISVQEYKTYYKTDEALIMAKDAEVQEEYKKCASSLTLEEFMEYYLWNGAWYSPVKPLDQGVDYYVFAYPYNDDCTPMNKITKVAFTTPTVKPSDIKFEISMNGGSVFIKPSNNDSYFFTYEDKEIIDSYYSSNPNDFFREVIGVYQEYEFIDEQLCIGETEENIADYYYLTPGREFIFFISGYKGGITTPIYSYHLIYKGENLPGEVIPLSN